MPDRPPESFPDLRATDRDRQDSADASVMAATQVPVGRTGAVWDARAGGAEVAAAAKTPIEAEADGRYRRKSLAVWRSATKGASGNPGRG